VTEAVHQAWVGALSEGQQSNWTICKKEGLWGTGSHHGSSVKAGDIIYVWQSGAGWLAQCVVTTRSRRPSASDPAPWPDGRDYKYIFGIRVMVELSTPVRPGTTDNIQNVTQIPNIRLGQFPSLTMEQHFAVAGFFVTPDRDIENVNDQAESVVAQRLDIGDTERSALIKARRGQGIFRENVLLIEQCCRVTGLAIVEHLRASHIKPWRVSTDLEKLDGYNGLLLSPHVDHLFDRGWITFTRDGFLKPSPSLDPVVLSTWRIEPKRVVEPFSDRHQEYLEYHREAVFHE
jgi:hypothetical protein